MLCLAAAPSFFWQKSRLHSKLSRSDLKQRASAIFASNCTRTKPSGKRRSKVFASAARCLRRLLDQMLGGMIWRNSAVCAVEWGSICIHYMRETQKVRKVHLNYFGLQLRVD